MENQPRRNSNFAVRLRQSPSGFNIDEGVWHPVFQKIWSDVLSAQTQKKRFSSQQNAVIPLEHDETGKCIYVKSEEGVYMFTSPGSTQVCGLYVIADPQHTVHFTFHEFRISCDKGGLLSVVDGWELNGQFFPGTEDHPKPAEKRFAEYCGENRPWKTQVTSQNVGLLEFRIPVKGEGFTVSVEFQPNPKPCNAVLQQPSGVYTLRNYGQRVNCTMSIIFPETFQILASSVGTQSMPITGRTMDVETGIVKKCKKLGSEDYVEVRGGDGLDPSMMTVAEDFCGMDSVPGRSSVDVACGNSAVRLVSSGKFENSVTVSFDLLMDWGSPSLVCPTLLETP
ncbi:Corticotropin-releasing factor-binding protein [Araneus ventricosus]|uniref:Corticotropin-releasing factor-binding protein n=1 Tax=Araneus ventricosus TaxID=182803 RepID=A0A4Y2AC92_ARAVE|nr:Corticotropin-releasing factor-binding protein [Araneus ventricosus]